MSPSSDILDRMTTTPLDDSIPRPRIPVLFAHEQVAEPQLASPSASKPRDVVLRWQQRGYPIDLLRPQPAEPEDLYRAHDRTYVDAVLECTGLFTSKDKASAHLKGGARKVIISAPGGKDVDATVVYGVNHQVLKATDTVISNASCTTNCLAPLVKPLHEKIGVVQGLMTTIHAYTNDQVLTDVYHEDLRRARSATQSMIPTKTGAAVAVGLVLPELDGKLDGFAIRVPTINVSVVDLSFTAARPTTVDEVNATLKAASEGPLKGILGYNTEPLVSVDFNHNPLSSVFDATQTRVIGGTLVKVLSWYDNEWGFSNRMLDTTVALLNAK